MSDARWQWPEAPLRTSTLGAFAVALVTLVAIGALAGAMLQASARVPVAAGGFFAAVMFLAVGFLTRHHPFDRFGPANQVSTLRAALTALVVAVAFEPPAPHLAGFAAAVGAAVTVLDGLDGRLARRSGMSSPFGARFDLEIDALLIMALAGIAWRHDKAGAWVLASGLLRYAFVGAAWQWPWLARPLPASRRRQAVCVIQVAGLIVAVAPMIQRPVSASVAAVALAALCYSFLVDILWLERRAQ